jgi:hypothetical protein
MANDRDTTRSHTGNVTPDEIADPSKHRQQQIFERNDRLSLPPGQAAEPGAAQGGDVQSALEPSVGDAFGSDTTGAVAPPAERNRPGASTKLGGTPGASATGSRGRQAD